MAEHPGTGANSSSHLIAALNTPPHPQHGNPGGGPGPARMMPQVSTVRQTVAPYPSPHQQQQNAGTPLRPMQQQTPQSQQFQQGYSNSPQQVVRMPMAQSTPPGPSQQFHPSVSSPNVVGQQQQQQTPPNQQQPAQPVQVIVQQQQPQQQQAAPTDNTPMDTAPPPSGPPPTIVQPLEMSSGGLIDKGRLDDLMKQIDSNTVLEDNVKELLLDYADEFVDEIIDKVCRLVQNRPNPKKLEVRDVELVLNMAYGMPSVPRSAVHVFGQQATIQPRVDGQPPTDAHKMRMQLIKKQLKKV